MLDGIKKMLFPQNYMEGKLTGVLEEYRNLGYQESIQEILNLDISILAKFLFIYESYDGATKTIGKLSREQKDTLLEEMEKINLENNRGRIWMYNHIVELCKGF